MIMQAKRLRARNNTVRTAEYFGTTTLKCLCVLLVFSFGVESTYSDEVSPTEKDDTDVHFSDINEPEESHASREASTKLMIEVSSNPEAFLDKRLTLESGKTVGPILDLRRHRETSKAYIIVDASSYFNQKVKYAIPSDYLQSYSEQGVTMSLADGGHLVGMVYYPEDYVSLENENYNGVVKSIP